MKPCHLCFDPFRSCFWALDDGACLYQLSTDWTVCACFDLSSLLACHHWLMTIAIARNATLLFYFADALVCIHPSCMQQPWILFSMPADALPLQSCPCDEPPHQDGSPVEDLVVSVALEQTALAHILNAEGEKIQKAVAISDDIDALLRVNASVQETISQTIKLETILTEKLKTAKEL